LNLNVIDVMCVPVKAFTITSPKALPWPGPNASLSPLFPPVPSSSLGSGHTDVGALQPALRHVAPGLVKADAGAGLPVAVARPRELHLKVRGADGDLQEGGVGRRGPFLFA
jgi:hypothetical protein